MIVFLIHNDRTFESEVPYVQPLPSPAAQGLTPVPTEDVVLIQPLAHAADTLGGMYDYQVHYVDVDGGLHPDTTTFPDLSTAMGSPLYAGHTFVIMTQLADATLDEFTHPARDVVYFFGSEEDGFPVPPNDLPGVKLALKSIVETSWEHFMHAAVATVMVHRFYQIDILGK